MQGGIKTQKYLWTVFSKTKFDHCYYTTIYLISNAIDFFTVNDRSSQALWKHFL
jgi:hypothetical protein